jgi:hypothetical protein
VLELENFSVKKLDLVGWMVVKPDLWDYLTNESLPDLKLLKNTPK